MKRKLILTLLAASAVLMLAANYYSRPPAFAYPAGLSIYVNPTAITKYTNVTHVGDQFHVTLSFANATNLGGIQYTLYWNNSVLNVVSVHDSLPWSGTPFLATNTTDNNYNASAHLGQMNFVCASLSGGYTGSVAFRTITFNITGAPPSPSTPGSNVTSALTWGPYGAETIFGDTNGNQIPATLYNGAFTYAVPTPISEYAPLAMLIALLLATSLVTIIYKKKR